MNVIETHVDLSPSGRMTAPTFLLAPLALYTTATAPTEYAEPVCVAHMVTFTRAVPILVYVPWAATTLSPVMAGTVKLFVPELEPPEPGEVAGYGVLFACEAVAEGLAAAEFLCVGVGDDPGALADDGDVPDGADEAVGEPPEAVEPAAEGLVPLDAHAVSPAPPMTAAMITAGTRRILMPLPSVE
jgi:hypothetical protein